MRAFFSASTTNARRLGTDAGVAWERLPCSASSRHAHVWRGRPKLAGVVGHAARAACGYAPGSKHMSSCARSRWPRLTVCIQALPSESSNRAALPAAAAPAVQHSPHVCHALPAPSSPTSARSAWADAGRGEQVSTRSDCAAWQGLRLAACPEIARQAGWLSFSSRMHAGFSC